MCFLALFNAYAMRVCLSIAITRMVVPVNVPEDEVLDDTCASLDSGPSTPVNETATGGTYEWSEYTQVRSFVIFLRNSGLIIGANSPCDS